MPPHRSPIPLILPQLCAALSWIRDAPSECAAGEPVVFLFFKGAHSLWSTICTLGYTNARETWKGIREGGVAQRTGEGGGRGGGGGRTGLPWCKMVWKMGREGKRSGGNFFFQKFVP